MKIGLVLRELHRSESDLAHELLQVSDRHKVDHEIFYVARDLAAWSQDHVREIAQVARDYGEELDPDADGEGGVATAVRDRASELVGRLSIPGLLLLRDLREVYVKASGVSVDWEMLAQAAQGIKHTDLLDVTARCHPQTLRQVRWANGKLKESSTQVLVS
ncbi:hypothetical protein [Cellulomonas xylanilytica]|uniref:Uncharacterized protein n=1 Tax=Cellulomonas xylanilytica TaxID=233583 RepID=A0A510V2E3_9CELL|nr:hypothetical protein [Cellulomonas xylanilytica]GEK21028.1 hypothetical protein CXY01_15480 [Cellulomonas xylanilytica]